MVASPVLIKTVIAASGIAAVSGGIATLFFTDFFKSGDADFVVVTKSTNSTQDLSGAELFNSADNSKNYKCKIANMVDLQECTIENINISSTNNWIGLSDLKKENTTVLTKQTLSAEKNFYKLKLSSQFLNKINFSGTPTDIEVVPIVPASNETNKVFAKLTPLFAIKDSSLHGKTKYALSKSVSFEHESGDTMSNITSFKCKLGNGNTTEESCTVHSFSATSSSTYADQVMRTQKDSSSTSSITKNHYYIIAFEAEKELTKLKNEIIVFASPSSETNRKSATFKPINPVVISPDAWTSGSKGFVL